MRSRNVWIAGALAVAGMAILGIPSTSQAGQAGTLDTTAIATTDDTLVSTTTTVGTIVLTDDTQRALTDSTANNLDSLLVVLSLEVYDDGYHGSSPSNNIADFAAAVTNDVTVSATTGMTTAQQNAGIANVTVQSNTLLDLASFATIPGGGANANMTSDTLTMVLNPAFTLSNSALAARAIAVSALQGGDGGLASPLGTFVTAIKFDSGAVYELSPEHNLAAFADVVSNTAVVDGTFGITTVQQNVGIANVQSAFNNIMFTTGDPAPIPFIGQ